MIKEILILKLYFNRAMSHINIPLSIISHITMFLMFLKIFNLNLYLIIPLTIIMIISIIFVGYLDVKYKVINKENELNYKYIPQIKKLLKK